MLCSGEHKNPSGDGSGECLSNSGLRHLRRTLPFGCKVTVKIHWTTACWLCQPLPPCATCCHLPEKWYKFQNILVYLQHDSRNERFEDMEKGTFKYPANRLGGHLPNRISEPSDTRSSSYAVIHGFNDFMTQCRRSPVIRIPVSPLKRIRDEPVNRGCEDAGIQTCHSA